MKVLPRIKALGTVYTSPPPSKKEVQLLCKHATNLQNKALQLKNLVLGILDHVFKNAKQVCFVFIISNGANGYSEHHCNALHSLDIIAGSTGQHLTGTGQELGGALQHLYKNKLHKLSALRKRFSSWSSGALRNVTGVRNVSSHTSSPKWKKFREL